MKRRIPSVASAEREVVKRVLGADCQEHSVSKVASTQGNASVLENTNITSNNGGSDMTHVASRTEAPNQITEKQLDGTIKGFPRDNAPREQTTEAQLSDKRENSEPEVISEKQLESKRTDGVPTVTTEKQLAPERMDAVPEQTTQAQLKANRKEDEKDVITEKQLATKPASLFERSAFARKEVKTAAEHIAAVVNVLAKSAVECGATPSQVREVVAGVMDSTQSRNFVLDAITTELADTPKTLDVAARAKYWGSKGMVIASATAKDVEDSILVGLSTLVACDCKVHPEMVTDVMEVVAEDEEGTKMISAAVDAIMSAGSTASVKASRKAAIREAMKAAKVQPAEVKKDDSKATREVERKAMTASVRKPSHIIEASLSEVGITKEMVKADKEAAKKIIKGFAKGAAASANMKISAVTNVTIDGDVIQIAIQTEEGEGKVEVPLAGEGVGPESAPLEGDTAGENLDQLMNETPTPAPAGSTGVPPPEAPLPTATPPAMAAAKATLTKEAQVPSGGGPGATGGPGIGGGAGDPMAPGGMPAAPAMDVGLQSFTGNEDADQEELPGEGEQGIPGTVCPFCHSTDTETGKKELPAGAFSCNGCGAIYQMHVNVEVLNPENMEFTDEKAEPKKPEEPSLPEMPVAASMKLTKDTLVKVADAERKFGHVCPACGMVECKPISQTAGKTVYVCPTCETQTVKEISVNKADPSDVEMTVAWTLNPMKIKSAGCPACKEEAKKFAALKSVIAMMKQAGQNAQKPETAFPMANCVERIARRWGANATASYGPCRGKMLADCVCKQLETFGLTKVRHMEKLAEVYTQKDPMTECVKDHTSVTFVWACKCEPQWLG